MEQTLKNKIAELRAKGWSYNQIAKQLNKPSTTIRYNSNNAYRSKAQQWSQKYRSKEPLQPKINHYFRENPADKDFEIRDVKLKFENNHQCYLTGAPIDLNEPTTYSLDHKIPVSKGGKSNLSNMGLLRKDVNMAKSDKTIEEFLALCVEVLQYNGYEVTKQLQGDHFLFKTGTSAG